MPAGLPNSWRLSYATGGSATAAPFTSVHPPPAAAAAAPPPAAGPEGSRAQAHAKERGPGSPSGSEERAALTAMGPSPAMVLAPVTTTRRGASMGVNARTALPHRVWSGLEA